MIICHCTGVTDAAILQMIREGICSLADITRRTGAGRCCEPCRDEIADLLGRSRNVAVAAPVE